MVPYHPFFILITFSLLPSVNPIRFIYNNEPLNKKFKGEYLMNDTLELITRTICAIALIMIIARTLGKTTC